MQKIVYYCDATSKKLSEDEVLKNQFLMMEFLKAYPQAKLNGVFSENCFPWVYDYWTEYQTVHQEALGNFYKTLNDHCVKFFQRKLAHASKENSGSGRDSAVQREHSNLVGERPSTDATVVDLSARKSKRSVQSVSA